MQAFKSISSFSWINNSLLFFKKHALVILSLGLIAALGRATQLGAFGKIGSATHIILEIIIELSRVSIFLYTLGQTRLMDGLMKVVHLLSNKAKRKDNWRIFVQKLGIMWPSILINMAIFLVIASFINYLIDLAAYETCMYASLKANRIIAASSSEWVLLLFFKNISVIPLTLVFNAVFLLWMTDRMGKRFSGV